jgi:hypothetical protein
VSDTSVSPTARALWHRARGLLVGAAVLAVTAVALAAVRSGEHHGALDPRSPDPFGSLATAVLLEDRGVETTVVTRHSDAVEAAGPDTTVLVARPDLLTTGQRRALAAAADRGGRTVLLAPGPGALRDLAPGVRAGGGTATVAATAPDCALPAARRAGDADLGGVGYRLPDARGDACYPRQGLPTLVRLPAAAGGDLVLLGAPDPLHNERLDAHGNASLVLQLLGSRPHLTWYLPSLSDPAADGNRNFLDLVPDGWIWGTAQLAVAAVLAALWRARRLGPLVPENLPVTVRASEATEGRARLYRSADARDRAAEALRAATRARLAPLVGVPAAHADQPGVLVPALGSHLGEDPTGSGGSPLTTLLFGPAPTDDRELVRLADGLDALARRLTPATAPTTPSTDKDRTP